MWSGLSQRFITGKPTYSTVFNGTENPLTEGGIWTTGGTTGLDWTDPRKTPGLAFGTQTAHSGAPFNDSIGHLSGYPADQFCTATIGANSPSGELEVELLLRFQITAHNARGYEIDIVDSSELFIVRWEGALNSFTHLDAGAITTNVSAANGTVWYAQMQGNVITVKCNGVQVFTRDCTGDATIWSTGNPGLGFYTDTSLGAPSAANTFGWASYTAGSL